ncbi:redoxin domain-containing protein [Halarcobacter sp.]|uniref:redoxin domain-containing protein n=1 Tax=Halarcobacter sp. TaxID=2321133 RepID=UPI002AAACF1F|nr:redoxin domain-containing protein [Halarcobacter sp.]
MNEKIKKYIKEIVKYSIFIIIALNIVSYYKSQDLNKENLPYDAFKLIDDKSYTLDKEKPTLVYFWATWCPICKLQSPTIDELSKNYQVITIASQSGTKEQIQKYLKENNLNFKVVDDTYNDFAYRFNVKAYPTTLIYDKNKNLKFTDVGYTSSFNLKLKLWWSK